MQQETFHSTVVNMHVRNNGWMYVISKEDKAQLMIYAAERCLLPSDQIHNRYEHEYEYKYERCSLPGDRIRNRYEYEHKYEYNYERCSPPGDQIHAMETLPS